MGKLTNAERRDLAELLNQEWDDVEELAERIAELRDRQREKKQKWIAVAQEVDPITGRPVGGKEGAGTPAGNAVAFGPAVSTYKQAENIALAATANGAAKNRQAAAWVVRVYNGTPIQWYQETKGESHED